MTEDEAKTRWCPFSRVMSINGDGGGNRWDHSGKPAESPNNSTCIGSKCMAWRLEYEEIAYPGNAIFLEEGDEINPVGGYCGLAGKP